MKKIRIILMLVLALSLFATPALAVKPNGATFVDWNLSAAVMPVPPYGSMDIPGSDVASKLIVNQPNGNTQVTITGVMGGLNPNTTYTVYLSNGYTPYVFTGWNLNGVTGLEFNSTKWPSGNPYQHILNISGNSATGSSTGNTYSATVSVTGNAVTIVAVYNIGSGAYPYTYTAIGIISGSGMLSGTWTATDGDGGTWNSTTGIAVKTYTGSAGWTGFFTSTIPAFTFTTDAYGTGSWHVNITEQNYTGSGPRDLSVWINKGSSPTILISDVFSVIFE
ncbi:MAG: hypothetical protein A2X25_11360 [Chloroflexi bacterium GWB2_49_20]|nr:MAG: hypothetical protein A2X25_11360 [Chloroflexi bacterium GWB2_49_20]OGN77610.1 MAG: hypothetical protein A2X26_09630 [Chloroflexi bacterium GWC2_49_37]OGN86386.1 MAG: hypothetical protein A2X27_05785 [Chloroflexi bacterium GWD2_49_16]HBG74622.1 hypothetical protein [Anaerolineae bacterium]